jgi:glycine hydroxymethyltransferase
MFRRDCTIAGFSTRNSPAPSPASVQRQEDHIELIASENYASPRVLEAQGSVLTNKYAEGYPGKRYYGGCEFVDVAEHLAIERAKQLFGADYANVQPHSGIAGQCRRVSGAAAAGRHHPRHEPRARRAPHARLAGQLLRQDLPYRFSTVDAPRPASSTTHQVEQVARARAQPKHDHRRLLRLFAPSTGARFRAIADRSARTCWSTWRMSPGWSPPGVSPIRCRIADVVTTTTHKTLRGPRGGLILARANDEITKKLNSLVFPGTQGGPLMHVIAAKAVAFLEALQPEFKAYQRAGQEQCARDGAPSCDRGYKVVSGGTDNHLFLLDLIDKHITGKDADAALGQATSR